jgi:hypothetical protein
VGLPASCFHNRGQRCAFGSLHQRDHLGLLVGAVRLRLGRCFLRTLLFLPLRLFSVLRFGSGAADSTAVLVSESFVIIVVSLCRNRFAVTTFIALVQLKGKAILLTGAIRKRELESPGRRADSALSLLPSCGQVLPEPGELVHRDRAPGLREHD